MQTDGFDLRIAGFSVNSLTSLLSIRKNQGAAVRTLVLCTAVLGLHSAIAMAAERSPACEAKRASIESQLSEATARGRSREAAGLQRALRANKAHCSDQSLAEDREQHIRESRRKVAAREKSLAEAERKGDAKKIANRKARLEEARAELVEAEKPSAH